MSESPILVGLAVLLAIAAAATYISLSMWVASHFADKARNSDLYATIFVVISVTLVFGLPFGVGAGITVYGQQKCAEVGGCK